MSQFQTQVNNQPAPGIAGDFASANPRHVFLAGSGSLVAGSAGVLIGLFAWASSNGSLDTISGETDAYNIVSNTGQGVPSGFVHSDQQGMITVFLAQASMLVPQGYPVTLFDGGDFWAVNAGTIAATAGMKVYANNANGTISANVTGTPPTSASITGSIAQNTASSTSTITANSAVSSSIAGTTLTAGAVTGVFVPGQTLTGTGVAAGTTILSQLTGTTGATGTYQVSISQTVASTTITASGGCLTVAGSVTGTIAVGQTITGGATATGTTITAAVSGTGGTGTYAVNISQAISGTALTMSGGTLTVTNIASGALNINDTITGAGVTAGSYIVSYVGIVGGNPTYLTSVSQTVSSESITVVAGTETVWLVASNGGVGELIKITSKAQV